MTFSLKWFGHASFLFKMEDQIIYIDPYEGKYTQKADVILITHFHHDHFDISKINKISTDNTILYTPATCISELAGRAQILKPGEKSVRENIILEAVHAYNYKRFRTPGTPYHPKGHGVGYIIQGDDKIVYHAGDTDFIPEMQQMKFKKIDLALLPIGGTYTMNSLEAAEAALTIKPKIVIPMHTLDKDPLEFKRAIEQKGQIEVLTLKRGQQIQLP